jgi:hypothetical protein
MSTVIPPVLPPWATDILMSLASIWYGMTWECHYTAWASVIMNIIFTAIFLGSNALPLIAIEVLLVYLALGVVIAKFSIKKLKSLFGTKTFGSLTLTASLENIGVLNWLVSILSPVNPFFNISAIFLIFWLVIGFCVHFLGWYYFGKE